MREVTVCPICTGKTFIPFLTCEDYTVSHETFRLIECTNCKFRITSPTPDNLAKYYLSDSYISHSKKATTLLAKIYLIARKFTLNWKLRIISKHANEQRQLKVLDYGCGTGEFLNACRSKGWTISGVEPSDVARQQASTKTSTIIGSSLNDLSLRNFTVITLWHVLEHVSELTATLEKLAQMLDDSGTMFIAVPNPNSWDAKRYTSYWAAYDVPRHLWHFSQLNMQMLLQQNNLKIIAKIPMKLDAFYVSLLSEKYLQNNKSILSTSIKAILSGIKSNMSAQKDTEYSSIIYIVTK